MVVAFSASAVSDVGRLGSEEIAPCQEAKAWQ